MNRVCGNKSRRHFFPRADAFSDATPPTVKPSCWSYSGLLQDSAFSLAEELGPPEPPFSFLPLLFEFEQQQKWRNTLFFFFFLVCSFFPSASFGIPYLCACVTRCHWSVLAPPPEVLFVEWRAVFGVFFGTSSRFGDAIGEGPRVVFDQSLVFDTPTFREVDRFSEWIG